MNAAELYDADFAEWALENAALLRSGRVLEADLEHIAEEIEAMAKRERRALYRRLYRLIEHLLKFQFQPLRRSASWENTIREQRSAARFILQDNPSFSHGLESLIGKAYAEAVRAAGNVIHRSPAEFPPDCPYTVEQLLDEEYLPK